MMLCPLKFNQLNGIGVNQLQNQKQLYCQCDQIDCAWWIHIPERIIVKNKEIGDITSPEIMGCALKILAEK